MSCWKYVPSKKCPSKKCPGVKIQTFTIPVKEYKPERHQERMPVELVLRIILEGEPTQEVSSPDAHQNHHHESRHLKREQISFLFTIYSWLQIHWFVYKSWPVWPDGLTIFQYLAIYTDVNLPNSIKYLPK